MNIQEYYMDEAQRVDNNETIKGYLVIDSYSKKPYILTCYYYQFLIYGLDSTTSHEVKLDTVKRVKVKPIEKDNGNLYDFVSVSYCCPNCDDYFADNGDKPNYCPECGMALDWS